MKLTSPLVILSAMGVFILTPLHAGRDVGLAERNPALSYWQAASQLPELSEAQAKRLQAVADGKEAFGADVLDGLDFGRATRFLRKAAASETDCDWGLAREDGAEMAMPHLSKLRELSVISLVLAEAEFLEGKVDAGIEHLWVAHHMARHAAAGDTLVGTLVQIAIERRTLRVAARHCMQWNAGERADYAERLHGLPAMLPVSEGFRGEVIMVDWFEREVEKNGGEAARRLGIKLGDARTVGDMIAGHRRMLAEAEEMLDLQGPARRRAAAQFVKRVEGSKNPLVRMLMPDPTGLVRSEDEVMALKAMLGVALEHGPGIAAEHVAGGPFTVTRRDGKLQSIDSADGVTLRFGAVE